MTTSARLSCLRLLCARTSTTPPLRTGLLVFAEAVAQTPGEAAGSLLRVGSEIRHRIRHVKSVRSDGVAASLASGHLQERAATFPRRLYATATDKSSSGTTSRTGIAGRLAREVEPALA